MISESGEASTSGDAATGLVSTERLGDYEAWHPAKPEYAVAAVRMARFIDRRSELR